MQVKPPLKISISVHMAIVKKLENSLCMYGDLKLYLCRLWQIIILENF
jgi:hypothetical protein